MVMLGQQQPHDVRLLGCSLLVTGLTTGALRPSDIQPGALPALLSTIGKPDVPGKLQVAACYAAFHCFRLSTARARNSALKDGALQTVVMGALAHQGRSADMLCAVLGLVVKGLARTTPTAVLRAAFPDITHVLSLMTSVAMACKNNGVLVGFVSCFLCMAVSTKLREPALLPDVSAGILISAVLWDCSGTGIAPEALELFSHIARGMQQDLYEWVMFWCLGVSEDAARVLFTASASALSQNPDNLRLLMGALLLQYGCVHESRAEQYLLNHSDWPHVFAAISRSETTDEEKTVAWDAVNACLLRQPCHDTTTLMQAIEAGLRMMLTYEPEGHEVKLQGLSEMYHRHSPFCDDLGDTYRSRRPIFTRLKTILRQLHRERDHDEAIRLLVSVHLPLFTWAAMADMPSEWVAAIVEALLHAIRHQLYCNNHEFVLIGLRFATSLTGAGACFRSQLLEYGAPKLALLVLRYELPLAHRWSGRVLGKAAMNMWTLASFYTSATCSAIVNARGLSVLLAVLRHVTAKEAAVPAKCCCAFVLNHILDDCDSSATCGAAQTLREVGINALDQMITSVCQPVSNLTQPLHTVGCDVVGLTTQPACLALRLMMRICGGDTDEGCVEAQHRFPNVHVSLQTLTLLFAQLSHTTETQEAVCVLRTLDVLMSMGAGDQDQGKNALAFVKHCGMKAAVIGVKSHIGQWRADVAAAWCRMLGTVTVAVGLDRMAASVEDACIANPELSILNLVRRAISLSQSASGSDDAIVVTACERLKQVEAMANARLTAKKKARRASKKGAAGKKSAAKKATQRAQAGLARGGVLKTIDLNVISANGAAQLTFTGKF